jgi:GT2 family glycosyltransferase
VETDPQLAPSVVSVMVVRRPGDWFDETLRSFAAQDYPNLRTLFLVAADDDAEFADIATRITDVIPRAFVRPVPGNPGFGPAANEVLRLVEGDNGFFLLCHDDIAPARDAVSLLVAELFRSNAGVVGPKFVDWDDPRVLQHVGLGVDRFGEVDPIVGPGEHDQEQHDAVRDVFVLPSACVLVRADLFRALGGFDPAIGFHGEDVELCWRAHLTGARVVVVPDARVRHRERLAQRRPDLRHRTLQSRHRMRTVATLTGASRLATRSVQLVLLTLVELVVGLFTGRFGEALSSVRALIGLLPRAMAIVARRRSIRGQRVVHEREVLSLQDRGSSRLNSYLRGKETATFVGAESSVRRWREASFGPLLAWFLVVLAVVVGSRSFIRHGVPAVGEFLPYPSPAELWGDYRSSFDSRGLGVTAATPTGWALLSVLSALTLFRMAALMTVSVVGLVLLGALGAWRLATVFPVNRARIAGMLVYVGTPLVPGVLSSGDWSALAWYAALPWMVHLLRRFVGIDAADPFAAADDLTDGIAQVGAGHRVRALAFLGLVVGLTSAFVPVTIVLWPAVALALVVGTLVAGGSWRVAGGFAIAAAASTVIGALLNLPWSLGWDLRTLVGARPDGSTGRGLIEIATLAPSTERFAVLAAGFVVPVVGAVAIARAWRFTWSVRGIVLVIGFGAAIIVSERGVAGPWMPSTDLLAAPVVLGFALGAASIVGGFGVDVSGRGFGWRQPVAVLANVAVVVGLVPAVVAIGDGAWHTPRTPLPTLLGTQLPIDPSIGDYRVLYVGDPRILPVPSTDRGDGVAWAVTDPGPLDFTDRFPQPGTDADEAIERAIDLVATGSTLRVGRLLAPYGIRYVVIPETDDVVSTDDAPLPIADGLVAAFENQLDIGSVYGPPSVQIFVNQSWIPVGAVLTGVTAEASRSAGDEALARADLSEATPVLVGADLGVPSAEGPVPSGVVHVGIPFDERLRLDVDGVEVPGRTGFGVTTAFDVDGGVAVLGYEQDRNRGWLAASQLLLWALVLLVAAGARAPFSRRRAPVVHDETLIDFDDDVSIGIVGEALVFDPVEWDEADSDPADDAVAGHDTVTAVAGDLPEPATVREPLIVSPPPSADEAEDAPVDLAALVAGVDAVIDGGRETEPDGGTTDEPEEGR